MFQGIFHFPYAHVSLVLPCPTCPKRVKDVTLYGTRYAPGAIVKVNSADTEDDVPLYTEIENIYIYKYYKVFQLRVLIMC